MTLQQLEYAVAVARWGSFITASEKCFVTQPTLSMQVKKLEEETGVTLFDRSRQPVAVTEAGKLFIEQAKVVLREQKRLKEIIGAIKGDVSGELRMGVIPTIAPYLVPLFIHDFMKSCPEVHLIIDEMTTDQMIEALKNESLDCGILATPLMEKSLHEHHLYNEPFVAYVSRSHPLWKKQALRAEEIAVDSTWLMSEGHCLRNQVLQLCAARKERSGEMQVNYQSGSIETLRRMVELGDGMTILPWLAVQNLSNKQMHHVR